MRSGSTPSRTRVLRSISSIDDARELERLKLHQAIDIRQRRAGVDRPGEEPRAIEPLQCVTAEARKALAGDREEVGETVIRPIPEIDFDLDRRNEFQLREQREHRPALLQAFV